MKLTAHLKMNTSKNILLVANWESDVGYAWWLMENFWASIANHFANKNQKTFLIYPKVNRISETIKNSHITILQHDFNDNSISSLLNLRRILHNNNIKYIYLTDQPFVNIKYLYLRIFGIKKIVIHDHTPGARSAARKIKRIFKASLNRAPYINADHLIAVTNFVYDRFIYTYCWPKEKCSIASNGITPLQLDKRNRHYAHSQFNLSKITKIVISTGRASKYKNIQFIIKCADELINKRKVKNLVFLFCGDGPDMEYFSKLTQQLNLTENFIFAGKRTDVDLLLQSATIGIHASKGEVGYSLSILEYMSAGLVTLVPDIRSVCQSVSNNENGIIYPPYNLAFVSNKIEEILNDKSYSDLLSSNAIKTVSEDFNIKNTNRDLVKILNNIFI